MDSVSPRWTVGEAEVERLLSKGDLEQVSPNDVHANALMEQANLDLDTARQLAQTNPTRAYESLYEAYRQSINGLLARQGLAVTREGGHVAYGEVFGHQTGGNEKYVDLFHEMRTRRNDLQYPTEATMTVFPEEVTERIEAVSEAVRLVQQMASSGKIGRF